MSNARFDSKAVLKTYKDSGSDLLVIDTYSHNRLCKQIFGGVTEFMLNKADIPIFMLHI